jgi:hypothetical protein
MAKNLRTLLFIANKLVLGNIELRMARIKTVSRPNKNAVSIAESEKTKPTKWVELLQHVSTAVFTKLLCVRSITAGLAT